MLKPIRPGCPNRTARIHRRQRSALKIVESVAVAATNSRRRRAPVATWPLASTASSGGLRLSSGGPRGGRKPEGEGVTTLRIRPNAGCTRGPAPRRSREARRRRHAQLPFGIVVGRPFRAHPRRRLRFSMPTAAVPRVDRRYPRR
jgi:hypothetical protein